MIARLCWDVIGKMSDIEDGTRTLEIEGSSEPSAPEIDINYAEKDVGDHNRCSRAVQIMMVIATIAIIIYTYVFVNIRIIKIKNDYKNNLSNNRVIATLIKKDDWYVFRYDEYECVAPYDESLIGKKNGTQFLIYFSTNHKKCSLNEEENRDNSIEKFAFFNAFYTVFGIAVTATIMYLIWQYICYPCVKKT